MYKIPILLVFFNRKDTVLTSFQQVKQIRPTKLYLAQDGPRWNRGEEEKSLLQEIRQCLLGQIDWECEVHTLFREQNLGCALGVKTAIDWLFENEEMGIILEDDCVVQPSFFPFMEEMLLRYASDNRIGMIAGYNGVGNAFTNFSYTFSRYKACWGWATWRRAWEKMDLNMSWRGTEQEKNIINNMGGNGRDAGYWKYRLHCIDTDYVSSWDWPWYFSLAAQNQLTIFPAVNLVSNIGFGAEATHTSLLNMTASRKKTGNLVFPLIHPKFVVTNAVFDRHFYRYNNTLYNSFIQILPLGLKKWIKGMLK